MAIPRKNLSNFDKFRLDLLKLTKVKVWQLPKVKLFKLTTFFFLASLGAMYQFGEFGQLLFTERSLRDAETLAKMGVKSPRNIDPLVDRTFSSDYGFKYVGSESDKSETSDK